MTGIRRTGKRALRGLCRDEVDVLYMICSQFAICSFLAGCWLVLIAVAGAGISDLALLVVPLSVMTAYWLNIRQ